MTTKRLTFSAPLTEAFSITGEDDAIVNIGPLPEGAVVSAVEVAAQAIGSDVVDTLGVNVAFSADKRADLTAFQAIPREYGSLVTLPAAGSCSDAGTFVPTFLSLLMFERMIQPQKRYVSVRLNSAGGNWTSIRGMVSVLVREGIVD